MSASAGRNMCRPAALTGVTAAAEAMSYLKRIRAWTPFSSISTGTSSAQKTANREERDAATAKTAAILC